MDVPLHFQKGGKPVPANIKATQDLSKGISDIGSRLRVLEERYLNLRKKMQVTDQSLIESEKSQIREIRELNNRILDMTQTLSDIGEKITVMLGELTGCVSQQEFSALRRYVDLWQPQNFITRQEVLDMINENSARQKYLEHENNPEH